MQSRQRLRFTRLHILYVVIALAVIGAGVYFYALKSERRQAPKPATQSEWTKAYQNGDFEAAAAKLESYVLNNRQDVDARVALMTSYAQLGKMRSAYKQAIIVTQERSKSPDAWYRLGLLAFELRRYDEAILSYKRAISIKPEPIQYHFSLATAYAKDKQYEQALYEWKFVLNNLPRSDPGSVPVYAAMGDIYVTVGNYEQAGLAYEKALSLKPDDVDLKRRLAKLRRQR